MAQFDDVVIELDADPEPKTPSAAEPKRRGRPPGSRNTAKKETTRKELAAQLTMFLQLAAAPVMMRDDVCGPAIMQQAPEIAEAVSLIVIDHERMLKFLMSGGNTMKYVQLAMAIKPIFDAVREHGHGPFNRGGGNYGDENPDNGYPGSGMGQSVPGFSQGMG